MQWRSQPKNLVMLCKFKIIICISLKFIVFMAFEHENISIACRAGFATIDLGFQQ